MTTQAHPLTPHFDAHWWLRQLLVILVALAIIGGATWLALSPSTVTDIEGTVARKWVETGNNQSTVYWVEISTATQHRRCSLADYQTQLIAEWERLEQGQGASMTCYGTGAVHLSAPR
ncbi:MAG: hypothetical protein KIT87_26780 [Anaerolineae bacterium]|nr:hypothetical protein [Anaerolineae bacterium]